MANIIIDYMFIRMRAVEKDFRQQMTEEKPVKSKNLTKKVQSLIFII